eukprot:4770341-Alexandrium_andersonii.AAC.1
MAARYRDNLRATFDPDLPDVNRLEMWEELFAPLAVDMMPDDWLMPLAVDRCLAYRQQAAVAW